MSINSSTNFSVSSTSSVFSLYLTCQYSMSGKIVLSMYTLISTIFLFPLYVLILYMGLKQWRHRRSAPAGMLMSHSDFFTFNMVIVELLAILGSSVFTLSNFIKNDALLTFGQMVFSMTTAGQTLFHVLACVERYLAVVHPITYMHLRESVGVRIRNIITVCVWLVCFGWLGVSWINRLDPSCHPLTALVGVCICVTLFCCISVVRILTHPGPAEVGRCNNRVDQSKQRALYIITAITTVQLLRFVMILFSYNLESLVSLDENVLCPLLDSGIFLRVPISLILPLLFLNRTGKLTCCRKNAESESGRRQGT